MRKAPGFFDQVSLHDSTKRQALSLEVAASQGPQKMASVGRMDAAFDGIVICWVKMILKLVR